MRPQTLEARGQPPKVAARRLSIFMFSSFRVLLYADAVSDSLNGKAKKLLKILAAKQGSRIPRDALIEALWPETDPVAGSVSLKVAVHSLRSVLEPNRQNGDPGTWIAAQNGSYCLNPAADIWVDVEAFQNHWQNGRTCEANGDLPNARAEYEKAAELYTGDYLDDDIYEDWTIVRREELKDIFLEIVGKLAHLSLEEQAHEDTINYCHRIIQADPCREDAYRMLMRCHAALSQYARTGAWYAVCRTMLKRDMGVGPSPQTVNVFEQLFEQIS